MKQGGQSWNHSGNAKQGVLTKFVCLFCGRKYKMQHSKDVHQRQCEEFNKKI